MKSYEVLCYPIKSYKTLFNPITPHNSQQGFRNERNFAPISNGLNFQPVQPMNLNLTQSLASSTSGHAQVNYPKHVYLLSALSFQQFPLCLCYSPFRSCTFPRSFQLFSPFICYLSTCAKVRKNLAKTKFSPPSKAPFFKENP